MGPLVPVPGPSPTMYFVPSCEDWFPLELVTHPEVGGPDEESKTRGSVTNVFPYESGTGRGSPSLWDYLGLRLLEIPFDSSNSFLWNFPSTFMSSEKLRLL